MLKRDNQDYHYNTHYNKEKRAHFLRSKSYEMLSIEKFDLYKCRVDEDR